MEIDWRCFVVVVVVVVVVVRFCWSPQGEPSARSSSIFGRVSRNDSLRISPLKNGGVAISVGPHRAIDLLVDRFHRYDFESTAVVVPFLFVCLFVCWFSTYDSGDVAERGLAAPAFRRPTLRSILPMAVFKMAAACS